MDSHFGKFRMRGWPNGRGLTLPPHTAYMNDWFRQVSFLTKRVAGPQMNIAIDLSKGTGLYPRDVLMKMMTRPMYKIGQPDGTTLLPQRQGIYPVAFQGAILQLTSPWAFTGGASRTVDWPVPVKDTAGMYDGIVPSRLTIQPGINIVRLEFRQQWSAFLQDDCLVWIRKNGAEIVAIVDLPAVNQGRLACDTGPIPVQVGDYFEARTFCPVNRSLAAGGQTQFSCEILDAQYPEV